ncbi:MAG: circadian clock KaiB family protein [Parachlamydiaceae bacterium]
MNIPTKNSQKPKHVFTLYISGMSPHSVAAVKNLKKICDQYLLGQYEIKTIDLVLEPEKAETDHIFATPTLIKRLPLPARKVIGDLSNTKQVLIHLDIQQD